jgi:hypothetical protein
MSEDDDAPLAVAVALPDADDASDAAPAKTAPAQPA